MVVTPQFRMVSGQAIIARFETIPENLRRTLREYFISLAPEVVKNVTSRMPVRTGKMVGMTGATITETSNTIGIRITNKAPYAAIQERGGQTPAHFIMPLSAKALAFEIMGGASNTAALQWAFAYVHHPGSRIPAKHFAEQGIAESIPRTIQATSLAVREALMGP